MSELELRVAWDRFVAPKHGPGYQDHVSQVAFDSVLSRHAEPQRHYHTADHVVWVLRNLDRFDHPDIDHSLAATAAFYHDAIYSPTSATNEAESADLAYDELLKLGWEPALADAVAHIIHSTCDHPTGGDITTAAFCCADLGVLAADAIEYADYVNAVRKEHPELDDTDWRRGRSAFLTSMMARPAVFDPRIAPDGWEARARANMSAELASYDE